MGVDMPNKMYSRVLKMEDLFDCRYKRKSLLMSLLILSEMSSCLLDSKPGHLLQMIVLLLLLQVATLCSRRYQRVKRYSLRPII